MEVNAPLHVVSELLADPEVIMAAQDQVKECEIVDSPDSETKFMKRRMQGNMLVSDRDLSVFLYTLDLTDGNQVVISFSEQHDSIPEVSGVVRANLIISLTQLTKIDENKTHVCSLIRLDPAGSIPTTFVNSSLAKQHEVYVKTKKIIEEKASS